MMIPQSTLSPSYSLMMMAARGICMHKCVFHQNSGDLSKSLVGSSVSAVSFSRNRIHPKVFFEGRGRGNLDFMFSSPLQVQCSANHIVCDCVRVDSACDRLGVRVCWGVDNPYPNPRSCSYEWVSCEAARGILESGVCWVEDWGSKMRQGRDRAREEDGRGSAQGLRG